VVGQALLFRNMLWLALAFGYASSPPLPRLFGCTAAAPDRCHWRRRADTRPETHAAPQFTLWNFEEFHHPLQKNSRGSL